MRKSLFLTLLTLLIFCYTNLHAQSTGNTVTTADKMNYKKNVFEVKKMYSEKKQIQFYYNVDSLLAYEQLLDREQNKIRFKKDEFLQLTNNYEEINKILKNFQPKPETFAKGRFINEAK